MSKATYEEDREYLKKAIEKWDSEQEEALSLSALRKKGQDLYSEVAAKRLETEKSKEATIASARKSRLYSEEGIKELCKKLDAKLDEEALEIQSSFRDSVKKVISHKRERLDKMISTAPTPEQLNLLSSLQIRKESLLPGEVYKIATSFLGNYNALSALCSIAKEAGINVMLPPGMDYEKLNQSLKWTEEYLNGRCEDLAREWRKMTPFGRLFFGTEWNDNLFEDNAISILDNAAQMSVEVAPAKRVITATEKEMIEGLFKDVPEAELADKVKTAAADSKAVEELLMLHPDYKEYIGAGTTKENK